MVHINGTLLVLSTLFLAGISAPAVHERQEDCALSSSASHPVAEHVVLEERQHAEEEEDVELEERQHVQGDAVKVINAQMEAEYQEEAAHLQVNQSAKAAAQEAEDIKAVAKSGAAAGGMITNYMQVIARDAVALERMVSTVTNRLSVSQGLALQRQFAALTQTLAQGTRVIRAARPLSPVESRQLLSSMQEFQNDFLDLITITISKKRTFAKLPYNIMPFIKRALDNLGSMTDSFMAALEGIVAPNARQSVRICRRTLSSAFSKASFAYA